VSAPITSGAVVIDLGELERLVEAQGIKLPATVAVGLRESVLLMIADVTKNRLRGQYLHRRTGTLIRSITASPPARPEVTLQGDGGGLVRDWFGTHLDYGRAHELGFRGRVQIPAHTRRLTRNVKRAKARLRQAQKRLGPAAPVGGLSSAGFAVKRFAHVRPHSRFMRIRARHYLRDTIAANTGKARLRVMRAVLLLLRTGRVPRGSEVRSALS
jgi:hypothetical protein